MKLSREFVDFFAGPEMWRLVYIGEKGRTVGLEPLISHTTPSANGLSLVSADMGHVRW